jgi:hypothetical protein
VPRIVHTELDGPPPTPRTDPQVLHMAGDSPRGKRRTPAPRFPAPCDTIHLPTVQVTTPHNVHDSTIRVIADTASLLTGSRSSFG